MLKVANELLELYEDSQNQDERISYLVLLQRELEKVQEKINTLFDEESVNGS